MEIKQDLCITQGLGFFLIFLSIIEVLNNHVNEWDMKKGNFVVLAQYIDFFAKSNLLGLG